MVCKKDTVKGPGIIYGGLSTQDIELLQNMKDKKKLIITEFNTIGLPTRPELRKGFEDVRSLLDWLDLPLFQFI